MNFVLIGGVAAGVLVLMALAVVILPGHFVPDLPDLTRLPGGDALGLADRLTLQAANTKARNDLRTGFLQAFAGLAVIVTLLTTLLQLQDSQAQFTKQQDQFVQQQDLAARGQLANRFSMAVDQLGKTDSSGNPTGTMDERVGGIFALESIARDASDSKPKPDDRIRQAVYDVLAAYIRLHAAWQIGQPEPPMGQRDTLIVRMPDVQAALTVLGRRIRGSKDLSLVLDSVALTRARLVGANFDGDRFIGADLQGVNFVGANLHNTALGATDLREADLNLAYLGGAQLVGADLRGADFTGANLTGADLTDATLSSTILRGAIANAGTKWPSGFDWQSAGVTQVK